MNSFFSGNILSGDMGGITTPNISNPKGLFIYNLVDGMCDALSASGDVYYDISLHGETPTRIYASAFTTPNNAIKVLCSSFMVFGTLFLIYLQIKNLIDMLNSGDFKNALNFLDNSNIDDIYKM